MKDLNSITISGIVTREPEMRNVGNNGTALLTFTIRCAREYVWAGQARQEHGFFEVKAWGDQAVQFRSKIEAAMFVIVQGRLTYESWDDPNGGGKRSAVRITAEAVITQNEMTDSGDGPAPVQSPAYQPPTYQPSRPKPPPFPAGSDDDPFDVSDESIDDIPF